MAYAIHQLTSPGLQTSVTWGLVAVSLQGPKEKSCSGSLGPSWPRGGPCGRRGPQRYTPFPSLTPPPHLTLSAHLLLCAPVPTFLREFRPYWSVLPRGGGGWSGMPAQLLAIRKAGERDPLPIHEYKHWFLAHSKTPINYHR